MCPRRPLLKDLATYVGCIRVVQTKPDVDMKFMTMFIDVSWSSWQSTLWLMLCWPNFPSVFSMQAHAEATIRPALCFLYVHTVYSSVPGFSQLKAEGEVVLVVSHMHPKPGITKNFMHSDSSIWSSQLPLQQPYLLLLHPQIKISFRIHNKHKLF